MPGYKVHMVGGALAGAAGVLGVVALGIYQPPAMDIAALITITILAALFPDVDTHSVGRKFYYGILAAMDLFLIINEEYQWAALLGLAAMLPAIGDHRGWTHTWWAMLVVPFVVLSIPFFLFHFAWQSLAPFFLAAVLGYFSHLALDKKF